MRSFLSVMRESGLTLKIEKSKFAATEITFVGSRRHGVNPLKVACVETMKPPTTKKEVRQVMGFSLTFALTLIGLLN